MSEVAPVQLDPFSFFGDIASRIPNLGGKKVGHDPKYVFHTPYVETDRGRVSFTIAFQNLKARRGTLVLSVNMFAPDGKTFARLVTSQRIALNRLASQGGSTTIEFEGFRGMTFALLGFIPDDTDVTADALHVTLNNPPKEIYETDLYEDARSTKYRTETVRSNGLIIDLDPPLFSDPVSQICTIGQFKERQFIDWVSKLDCGTAPDQDIWEQAYVLQSLNRYGFLEKGARALGFAVGESKIPTLLLQYGLEVTATDPIRDEADLREETDNHLDSTKTSFSEMGGAAEIIYRDGDLKSVPVDLLNFDAVWSCGALHKFETVAAVVAALEVSLRCIRPGGIAVHTMDVSITMTRPASPCLLATEIERIGLLMISRGHEIARIKFAKQEVVSFGSSMGATGTVPFGLIIRKAISPL